MAAAAHVCLEVAPASEFQEPVVKDLARAKDFKEWLVTSGVALTLAVVFLLTCFVAPGFDLSNRSLLFVVAAVNFFFFAGAVRNLKKIGWPNRLVLPADQEAQNRESEEVRGADLC